MQNRRQEARAQAAAPSVDAVQTQAYAAEMERLVTFGQALGRSLDLETIRSVSMQHLPKLANTEDAWVMIRVDAHWQTLLGSGRASREIQESRVHVADRTLIGGDSTPADPITVEGHLCLPLTAGGHAVGVLGVPESAGPFSENHRRTLAVDAVALISRADAALYRAKDEGRNCVRLSMEPVVV